MIDVFYYSIAGKKHDAQIDEAVSELLLSPNTPSKDKKILKHTQEVAENGNYPSADYYSIFYSKPSITYRARAEILTYVSKIKDFFAQDAIQRGIVSAINDAETASDLRAKVTDVLDKVKGSGEKLSFSKFSYTDQLQKPSTSGIMSGVKEIDDVTHGFQPGSIAVIGGFTGHGKSTWTNSIVFQAANLGKKCCVVSLEIAPDIAWLLFQTRWLNDVKGLQVTSDMLLFKHLPKDLEEKVIEYTQEFQDTLAKNILIIDETYLSKSTVLSYKALGSLFRQVEEQLGGLDLVTWDHIGQMELMFPTCGNQIIKQIQAFTKTYTNAQGVNPVSIFAIQTNRDGEKRARRRNGLYDIQALSDLNETERSASYILFMYTSDDMKLLQETKVMMLKNRYGAVVTEPVSTTFNPAIITVGQQMQQIEVDADTFNGLDIDFDDDF